MYHQFYIVIELNCSQHCGNIGYHRIIWSMKWYNSGEGWETAVSVDVPNSGPFHSHFFQLWISWFLVQLHFYKENQKSTSLLLSVSSFCCAWTSEPDRFLRSLFQLCFYLLLTSLDCTHRCTHSFTYPCTSNHTRCGGRSCHQSGDRKCEWTQCQFCKCPYHYTRLCTHIRANISTFLHCFFGASSFIAWLEWVLYWRWSCQSCLTAIEVNQE